MRRRNDGGLPQRASCRHRSTPRRPLHGGGGGSGSVGVVGVDGGGSSRGGRSSVGCGGSAPRQVGGKARAEALVVSGEGEAAAWLGLGLGLALTLTLTLPLTMVGARLPPGRSTRCAAARKSWLSICRSLVSLGGGCGKWTWTSATPRAGSAPRSAHAASPAITSRLCSPCIAALARMRHARSHRSSSATQRVCGSAAACSTTQSPVPAPTSTFITSAFTTSTFTDAPAPARGVE